MPTFHVTAPDGHVLEITGPEGSTQEQAIEQAKKQYQPKNTEAPEDQPRTLKDFITSPHGFIREGLGRAGRGVMDAINTPGLDSKLKGASEVVRGLGTAAIPAAIPFAVANPLTSAAALAAGTGAQYVGEEGSKVLGAPPGASALIGDVAGLGAGGLAGKGVSKLDLPSVPRAASAVGKGLKVAAPDLIGGGSMIAGGEILAKVPGMEWPARIGMGYPGARQMGRGMHAGFNATREALNLSKPVAPPGPPSMKWMQDNVDLQPDLGPVQGPITKPTLPSGRTVGPIVQPPKMERTNLRDQYNVSNAPEDIPVGPIARPTLPSGRQVGRPTETPSAAPEVKQVKPIESVRTEQGTPPETPQNTPERQETAPEKTASGKVLDFSTGQDKVIVKNLRDKLNELKRDPNVDSSNIEDIEGYMGELEDIVKKGPEFYNKLYDHPKGYEAAIENSSGEMEKAIRRTSRTLRGEITPEQSQRESFNDVAKKQTEVKETTDPNKQYSWDDIKEKYGSERVRTTKAKLQDLSERLKKAEIPIEKFLSLPQEAQDAIVKIPKHATQVNRSKYSTGFHRGYSDLLKEIHGQSE